MNQGEVVTLLGRNGAGRTTTLRAIMGLTGARKGSIKVNGVEIDRSADAPDRASGRRLLPGRARHFLQPVGCEENLMLPPLGVGDRQRGMRVEEIYAMFPNLTERAHSQGTRLSGGEQQMLAVARILRTGARLLLLDEISEGLAPVIVQALARMIIDARRPRATRS